MCVFVHAIWRISIGTFDILMYPTHCVWVCGCLCVGVLCVCVCVLCVCVSVYVFMCVIARQYWSAGMWHICAFYAVHDTRTHTQTWLGIKEVLPYDTFVGAQQLQQLQQLQPQEQQLQPQESQSAKLLAGARSLRLHTLVA